MKTSLLFISLLAAINLYSQSVGIGTSNPDHSAALDITSTTGGLLIPRMTSTQRLAISSPATGLMVYDTSLNQFMIYNGSSWTPILNGLSGWMTIGNSSTSPAVNFIGTIDNNDFVTKTFNTERMRVDTNGAVGIGQTAPDAKSILDIKSTVKGMLFPRMSTAQRLAIINNGSTLDASRNGLTVYDSTLHATMQWNAPSHHWDTLMTSSLSNGLYWKLLGNTGTDTNINYLGTTDSTDLIFRTNGRERFRIRANGLFYTANQGPGTSSIYLGGLAGSVSTGSDNSGIGLSALQNNTTGSFNSALGSYSLDKNTTGMFNTASGFAALFNNTTGSNNTAIGDSSLYGNTSGYGNVGVGEKSLKDNTTAFGNTGVGKAALQINTTGFENVAMGDSAMAGNINVGTYNVGIGNKALLTNNGDYNVAMGYEVMENSSSASTVVAIGYQAMQNGPFNANSTVALGYQVMQNASANQSVAIGYQAGMNCSSYSNVMIGYQSMYTDNNHNIGIGQSALYGSGTYNGSYNAAVGCSALNGINDNGSTDNVAFGHNAGGGIASGSENVAIGTATVMGNSAASYNTVLGAYAGTMSAAATDASAIGSNASVDSSYSMIFGDYPTSRWGFAAYPTGGQALTVGTSSSNGNGAYLTKGGVWTNASDKNLKTGFETLDPREILDRINQLEISRWKYIGTAEYHIGPMAQDFHSLFQVGLNDKSISTIDPAGVALIGIQALSKDIHQLSQSSNEKWQNLTDENHALKVEIEELKDRIDRLEKIIDKK